MTLSLDWSRFSTWGDRALNTRGGLEHCTPVARYIPGNCLLLARTRRVRASAKTSGYDSQAEVRGDDFGVTCSGLRHLVPSS